MGSFRTVAKTSDIAPGAMKVVDLDGEEVVVANVDGVFFAFSNTCTHKGGPLAEGELAGETVTCPGTRPYSTSSQVSLLKGRRCLRSPPMKSASKGTTFR